MADFSKHKFGTKAIHAGAEPDPSTGAIMTPFSKRLPMFRNLREPIKDMVMPAAKTLPGKPCKKI
jgi:hypothetical protein